MQHYQSEQIEALLYQAGRTLMALRVSGCWPSGHRSGMPECLRDPEDMRYAETEYSPAAPSPSQVSAMDLALGWISLLPAATEAQVRIRKLVWARCLVSPRSDRPIYSWARLGRMLGLSENTAKTRWIDAVAEITAKANRQMHPVCADTLRRIQSAGVIPSADAPKRKLEMA